MSKSIINQKRGLVLKNFLLERKAKWELMTVYGRIKTSQETLEVDTIELRKALELENKYKGGRLAQYLRQLLEEWSLIVWVNSNGTTDFSFSIPGVPYPEMGKEYDTALCCAYMVSEDKIEEAIADDLSYGYVTTKEEVLQRLDLEDGRDYIKEWEDKWSNVRFNVDGENLDE